MLSSVMIYSKTEGEIIAKILKFSEFERFYSAEWKPRKDVVSVGWAINPLCNHYGMQGVDKDGMPFIQLRSLPVTLDDAFIVAHEAEHVIKYFNGQYLRFAACDQVVERYQDGEISDLTHKFGSMFDDPLIDAHLHEKYGFNSAHHYTETKFPDIIKSVNSYGDPKSELIRFKSALFFSQCALQWDSINDSKAKHAWNSLKKLYKKKRPLVTKIGTDLYYMSKENGYDTLNKQRLLFNKIAQKYTIDGIKICDILHTL